ncbi:PAS domain-containing sensor histidine kinase [Sphingomonas sp. So64.6b]|uniref:PAS domain-containing hybrid sensor histidine kinase/response regulator n=1 Tax=Sphingomonas sp. So64.6b TaxID=2997354 RepID=UPI001FCE7AF3|nr:PAS domain-containing sensor histidine kinase [Sphingomonas sp. So64.6b]
MDPLSESASGASEFNLIADSAPVPMWVTRLDRRRSFVNRAYVDFLGVSYAEAVDFDWRLILHPDDQQRIVAESIAGEASLKTFTLDARYRRCDGEWRWLHSVSQPRYDANGAQIGFIGVAHDITQAKQAEQALRQRERQLSALIDQTSAGFAQVGLDGIFTLVNDKFCAIVGRTRDELLRLTMQQITHPDDLPANIPMFEKAVRDGTPYTHEKRYFRPDGSIVWVNNSVTVVRMPDGTPFGVLAVTIDVTDRRDARDALTALNQRLEQEVAVRTAERDGMWRLSRDLFLVIGRHRRIIAVNPAVDALGYRPDEVEGLRIDAFIHPEDLAGIGRAIRAAAAAPVGDFLARLRAKDGSWRHFAWSAAPGEGEAFVIGRDVTVETQRRDELELAQEALRQAQKVEALGQLTGGVAHDFNNLLTPIIGSLDLLQRRNGRGEVGGERDEREQRLLRGALDAAERARTLVQRLLAFARRQPLQPGPIDVAALIGGMAGLIGSTAGSHIRVVTDLPPDLPPALADANQLEMAILNLSVNSRDAMPDGGTLTLSARARTVTEDDRTGLPPGDYISISVSDTGTGMDEAVMARAIEPFFSTKGIGKGTGLGLSMVHGLASQLGGTMLLTSEPGQGTTVELVLRTAEPRVERRAAARLGQDMPHAAGQVLLVDDEAGVRHATAEMLNTLGLSVVEAESACEALTLLATSRPDYIVTDHLMPDMTGAELAGAARTLYPGIRILLISGYADLEGIPPDLHRLSKPFRLDELAASMAALH